MAIYICLWTRTLQNSCAGGGKPARVCICVTYHRTHMEVEENLLIFFTFFLSSSLPTIFSFVPFLAELGSEYKVNYYPTDPQANSSDQYFEVVFVSHILIPSLVQRHRRFSNRYLGSKCAYT